MAQNNNTILTKSWLQGSNDYQQRMPAPDQATMKQTMDAIFAPMNGRIYNEFVDILVNRIGDTLVHQNPKCFLQTSAPTHVHNIHSIVFKTTLLF